MPRKNNVTHKHILGQRVSGGCVSAVVALWQPWPNPNQSQGQRKAANRVGTRILQNDGNVEMNKVTSAPSENGTGARRIWRSWIISHMPPHIHYVETLTRAAWPSCSQRSYQGVSEVVNDLDGDLSNFWQVLASAEMFADFSRIVQATPFSQELFNSSNIRRGLGQPRGSRGEVLHPLPPKSPRASQGFCDFKQEPDSAKHE
jgi:hypothetical protein